MSYGIAESIRWDVKPWGPLNKTGRLEFAPKPRTIEEVIAERKSKQ